MRILPVKLKRKKASVPMLVDDWDYEILKERKWSLISRGYAKAKWNGKQIMAHHIIMWFPEGKQIDHIDGNKLNNQKRNLRICSHAENQQNRGRYKNNTSGYKGVSWNKSDKNWQALIGVDSKLKRIGGFKTAEEASAAYKQAAVKYHKDFASW